MAALGRILLALFAAGLVPAATAAPRESQVKAVFLFNFAQFTDWPPEAFPSADSPLVIGVLGDNPFGTALDEVVRGERVAGRPLEVRRCRLPEEAAKCHILYISRSEGGRLGAIRTHLAARPVLTVADGDGPAASVGMIRFATAAARIRLQVHLGLVQAAGLTLSSKLLRAAEIVEGAE